MADTVLGRFAPPTAHYIDRVARELVGHDQFTRDGALVTVGRRIAVVAAQQDPPLSCEGQTDAVEQIVEAVELRIAELEAQSAGATH